MDHPLCGWRMICNVTQCYALMNVHCILKCQPRLCYVAEWLHARLVSRGGILSPPKLPLFIYVPDLKTADVHGDLLCLVLSELHSFTGLLSWRKEIPIVCENVDVRRKASIMVPPFGKMHEMLHMRSGRGVLFAQTPSINFPETHKNDHALHVVQGCTIAFRASCEYE